MRRGHTELTTHPGMVRGHEIIATVGSVPKTFKSLKKILCTHLKEEKFTNIMHPPVANEENKHRSSHMPKIYHICS
jgi:hypothetical protein